MVPDNRAVECGENGPGPAANAADRARALCLRQLTAGPRTADQLAQAMSRGGIEPDVVVAVLARLTDVGLIDDEAFAAAWVESRHSRRGTSRRALAQELRTRGVADDLIGAAVGRLDPDREAATARGIAGRRLAATRGLDTVVRFRRAASALARKGYPPSLTYRVIREELEAEGADVGSLADQVAVGDE